MCSMVKVPSLEAEDRLRISRERKALVAERIAHNNRIKGLLFNQGIRDWFKGGKAKAQVYGREPLRAPSAIWIGYLVALRPPNHRHGPPCRARSATKGNF